MVREPIEDTVVPRNTGKAFILRKGQRIRIIGEPGCIVDFVVFNLDNLKERFDQARTKLHQNKLFLSTGDKLLSKFFNPMMTIVEDTYKEGTHDLECGMCSGVGYQRLYKARACPELQIRREDLPDYGCWENLTEALKPWNIAPEDIPSPFNIFQTMEIDGHTGKLAFSKITPKEGTHVELRAEMNCLVAMSACPNITRGKSIRVQIYSG